MSTTPRDQSLCPRLSKTEPLAAHGMRPNLETFALLTNSTRDVHVLFRYVAIGGLCALLNNVAVIALVWSGIGIVTASAIAFGPVLIIGYRLHAHFTFRAQASRISFVRFTLGIALNYPLWIASLYVLCNLLRLSISIAAPLTTAMIFAWNFASAKWAFLSRRIISFGGQLRRR
jgi:putative flippase GtrA